MIVIKVWNKYFTIKYKREGKFWYCKIPTSSTPVVILSKDGENFFISMLSGGKSGAVGLYNITCKKKNLQETIDLFFEQIKLADDVEVR